MTLDGENMLYDGITVATTFRSGAPFLDDLRPPGPIEPPCFMCLSLIQPMTLQIDLHGSGIRIKFLRIRADLSGAS